MGFNAKTNKGIVILSNTSIELDEVGQAYLLNRLSEVELKTPIVVSKETLIKLNGDYELVPGFVLTITNENDKLFVQATGQARLGLAANSETEYVNQAVQVKIVFEVNEKGIAQSLTMYQAGQILPGVKK
jgi:D-alanyl-D-alanine-carboxypeptidase/D-alanyl-D-alanine-endopeptidase